MNLSFKKKSVFYKAAHGSGSTRFGLDMGFMLFIIDGPCSYFIYLASVAKSRNPRQAQSTNNYKGGSSNGGTKTHVLSQKVI